VLPPPPPAGAGIAMFEPLDAAPGIPDAAEAGERVRGWCSLKP
jgi:hypothetical protein